MQTPHGTDATIADVEEALTPADVERRWKISQRMQRILRQRDGLPHFRLGRNGKLVRYKRSELENWIAARAGGKR